MQFICDRSASLQLFECAAVEDQPAGGLLF